jgi:Na+/H+-dicarboxylate symporter
MAFNFRSFLHHYSGILLLLGGIAVGSILGLIFGKDIAVIKPIGDIFLNLLFTAVIPLVFFAIASAIAHVDQSQRLGRILAAMFLVFLCTILLAAFLTIVATWLFPIPVHLAAGLKVTETVSEHPLGEQITALLSVNEFFELLTRKNMLPFIIFSVLLGFSVLRAGEAGAPFRRFLHAGNEVMKQLLILIMKLAPIGLGAYFAYQVGVVGPQLFGAYARPLGLYYGFGLFYFVAGFSLYAFLAGGIAGVKRYWSNNMVPSVTAVGTCSSIATIPANLDASRKMGVPEHVGNVVIPLGASLHKDGSSISSIIKISVAFAILGKGFNSADAVLLALGITVIVSIVEGGIPNGGYVGELLAMSVYGFPIEVLPALLIIGTLVDPMATLLNATGDTVAAMLVTRILKRKTIDEPMLPSP